MLLLVGRNKKIGRGIRHTVKTGRVVHEMWRE